MSFARLINNLADKAARARERHEEKHRSTGLDFALADGIDYLNSAAWDHATRNASLFMSRPYLRVMEAHGPENVRPRYALAFCKQEAVAAVAAQYVTIQGGQLPLPDAESSKGSALKKALLRVTVKARSRALDKLDLRLLICGDLLAWGCPGAAFAPGKAPEPLWPAVSEALYRIARAQKLAGRTDFMYIKDIAAHDRAALRALAKFDYEPIESDPDMVLPIEPAWKTFEDYLQSLNHKYRKNAKAIFRQVQHAGFRVEPLADVAAHAARLDALYRQVQERASTRYAVLRPSFLPALAAALREQFRCTVIRKGENIVAFVTTLRDGAACIGYYLGLDYGAMADGPLYLRLLFATVADAIELGCTRLSLGRTALEPKARLGARPVPMHVLARHRHPVLNALVRGLQFAVPHDEAPERHPFKED